MQKGEYTHYRKGALVYKVDGTLEFDGRPENMDSEPTKLLSTEIKKRGTRGRGTCIGLYYSNRGINAAKRFVRTNNISSYNV